jgi:hypothetical protein
MLSCAAVVAVVLEAVVAVVHSESQFHVYVHHLQKEKKNSLQINFHHTFHILVKLNDHIYQLSLSL